MKRQVGIQQFSSAFHDSSTLKPTKPSQRANEAPTQNKIPQTKVSQKKIPTKKNFSNSETEFNSVHMPVCIQVKFTTWLKSCVILISHAGC